MVATDAMCLLHLLLFCFLQTCHSQHASALRECHCTSGCDVDFRCSSGCLQGWSGPTCQIRNIALNKLTRQSSTLNDCRWADTEAQRKVCGNKTSSLAVDGVVSSDYWSGTCTHTALYKTSAWWTVDLGETHLITNLTIFFLLPERMRGFLVKVDHNKLCYLHSQSYLPSSPISISCDTPTHGQLVTVRLPTLAGSEYILNLFEVEIYECADGTFGPDCGSWCFCKSTSEVCDKITGHCESGCADGRTGADCQGPCQDGTYGFNCADRCGRCQGGQPCDKLGGECQTCALEFKPPLCQECRDFRFGDQCDKKCRCKDTNEVCDKKTGQCHSGCEDGLKGLDCHTQLPNVGSHVGMGVAYTLVFVLAGLLMLAVYRLKRRKQRITNVDVAAPSPYDTINEAFLVEEMAADGVYLTAESTVVKVSELQEYITEENDKLVSEYERVPMGLLHPHAVAAAPENRPKNRFTSFYPYDHSRVVLHKTPGNEHSDYINANYIDTYTRKKAFIATQGPMPNTVGDFWRMVWQEETDVIVMLTRLKEGIKVKCEKYWPEEKKPLKLGDLTITNDGITEGLDYCVTHITIQHAKLNERRKVTHLHYVSWPDHDVPSAPAFVRFWKVFRALADGSRTPVVVHCSTGAGRTGTFIAMEALVERARQEGVVDVHDVVLKMCADRVSMVQTKEQYLFLHQVVLEALYSDTTHMTLAMFDSRFSTDNLEIALASEEAILKTEWERLIKLKNKPNVSETAEDLRSENVRKNHSKDILPADKDRPLLTLPVAESNDYINAVFVRTETRQKGLLATQLPLPRTVVDFWRMVFDHNVQTVVSLVSEECSSQADEVLFWPKTNKVLECGPFRVEKLEPKDKDVVLKVLLKDSDDSTNREVMLMFVSDWEEGVDTPTNTSQFLCLINDLDSRSASGNIAVMCKDDASKCGLLCAVLNIIQRLKQDQEIDVYLTVRLLQTVRPSFVTSFAQYQFCYRMIQQYQKTVNTVYEYIID